MEEELIKKSLRIIIKSSLFIFLMILLSKLLTYCYRISIAKVFGPEEYGIYSLAIMTLSLVITIASIGLPDGLLRFVSIYRGKKEYNKISYIVKSSLITLTVSSIIFAAVLFSFSPFIARNLFHNESLIIFLRLFSFIIPPAIIGGAFLSTLQAFEHVNLVSFIVNLVQNGLKLIIIFLLIFLGFGSKSIPLSYSLSIICFFIISYYFFRKHIGKSLIDKNLEKKTKKAELRKFVSYSWPLLLSGVLSTVLFWTDSISIGYFRNASEVGTYNAAVPIALLMALFPELLTKLFFPLINRNYSGKRKGLVREISKQIEKWIFMCNLPLLLIILLYPGVFINILFGSEYLPAVTALRFLAISAFFASIQSVPAYLLLMVGKSKILLFNTIISGIANIILNSIFVPIYGISGAAAATMIVSISICIVYFIQLRKYLNFLPIRRNILKVVISALISIATIIFFKDSIAPKLVNLIIVAALFYLIYFVLLITTKSFDRNDMSIIESIKKKIWVNKIGIIE